MTYIIFTLFLIILIYILFLYNKSNITNKKNNKITYYKSDEYLIAPILKDTLIKYNFIKSTNLLKCNLYTFMQIHVNLCNFM